MVKILYPLPITLPPNKNRTLQKEDHVKKWPPTRGACEDQVLWSCSHDYLVSLIPSGADPAFHLPSDTLPVNKDGRPTHSDMCISAPQAITTIFSTTALNTQAFTEESILKHFATIIRLAEWLDTTWTYDPRGAWPSHSATYHSTTVLVLLLNSTLVYRMLLSWFYVLINADFFKFY